jgi:hypothetical protein
MMKGIIMCEATTASANTAESCEKEANLHKWRDKEVQT